MALGSPTERSEQSAREEAEAVGSDTKSLSGLTVSNGILLALGYAPLLVLFLVQLWGRPQYQFFPMALAGAGFLAWTRLKDVARPLEPGLGIVTALLLAFSFLFLAAGVAIWSPWMGSIAAILGLVGLVWWLGGLRLLRSMSPALVLLVTIIPPPLKLDETLSQHLRVLAVFMSSRVLDSLSVTHTLSGNIIELPKQSLLVEEACSGIYSLLSAGACCLFYLFWRRRSAVHVLVGLAGIVAFVLLGNVVRITLGAWLKFRHGIDILSGWPHELLGLLLFAGYLGLILSLDQLMVFLTYSARRPDPSAARTTMLPAKRVQPPRRVSPYWGWVAGCAFAVLGLVALGRGWGRYQQTPEKPGYVVAKSALRQDVKFAMPEVVGNWRRLSVEKPATHKIETMGVFSQVWHYQGGNTIASVAFDYPFVGYHDVTLCYSLSGWSIASAVAQSGGASALGLPFTEVQMDKDMMTHGELWFASVDEQGRWLPGPSIKRDLWDRFKTVVVSGPTTYRVQVLISGYRTLKPEEREQARRLFEEARKVLWQQLAAQLARKS